jgi:hypothetical protein
MSSEIIMTRIKGAQGVAGAFAQKYSFIELYGPMIQKAFYSIGS